MNEFQPISTVEHNDGLQVWLRSPYSRVRVWDWHAGNQRWQRGNSLHWAEGAYGPEEWAPVSPPNDSLAVAVGALETIVRLYDMPHAVLELASDTLAEINPPEAK